MTDYRNSGVDIDKGNQLIDRIEKTAHSTFTPNVVNPLGGFASLFRIDLKKYKKPLMVSSTDGVGTKLKLAFMSNKHDTIGIDLVAMCVNDVLVYGAEPVIFLDYVALGGLDVEVVSTVIEGISKGCKMAGCSLVGGETAEMPSFYHKGEYDCAGFTVGIVEEDKVIDGSRMQEGDVVIAVPSSGVHSNGYSLVRHIFFETHSYKLDHIFSELGIPLCEELLKPTHIYVKPVLELLSNGVTPKAMCHVTGGGIVENLPRVIKQGMSPVIDAEKIRVLPIFKVISSVGKVSVDEMMRVFNMGVGFILVVSKNDVEKTNRHFASKGLDSYVIGHIEDKGDREVKLINKIKL